jgi:hypothetical protein
MGKKSIMKKQWVVVAGILVAACASTTPGSRPTDMSATSHEAAAKRHGDEASTHAAHFDPNATERRELCRGGGARAGLDTCWTSVVNPTAEHLDEAERHRKMATDHRAGSKALQDAEAAACAGLNEEDRDTSPFDHREDIVSSEPLQSIASGGKGGSSQRLLGASLTVKAVPGLTKEYLQRLVNCHSARNASMGFAMQEMTSCPLSVKGSSATVESAGAGFRVDIRADDSQAANEVLRRAKALTLGK